MCHKCHNCFVTLEATTSGAMFALPNSSRILKGRISSVQMRRAAGATLKTATGKTLAADTVIATAHLSVKNSNGTELANLPMTVFQRDYNSPEPLCVNWRDVDPTQCVVTLDTGATGYSATAAVEIIFGIDCDECPV